MTPEEAIELISETNEPLAEVLRKLLKDQNQIRHSQEKVMEALILHMMGTDPYKIDLSFLKEILDNQ
jgi:hypothetical protein